MSFSGSSRSYLMLSMIEREVEAVLDGSKLSDLSGRRKAESGYAANVEPIRLIRFRDLPEGGSHQAAEAGSLKGFGVHIEQSSAYGLLVGEGQGEYAMGDARRDPLARHSP